MDSTMTQFELRFQSLSHSRRSFAFPCDPKGSVNMDQLSDRTRNNYLYARAMVASLGASGLMATLQRQASS